MIDTNMGRKQGTLLPGDNVYLRGCTCIIKGPDLKKCNVYFEEPFLPKEDKLFIILTLMT